MNHDYRILIRDLLRAGGVSQRELARRLSVTEAVISQMLSAKGNPTVRTLARVAAVLGRRVRVRFVPKAPVTTVPEQIAVWSLAA